jgi:hypothetical protein
VSEDRWVGGSWREVIWVEGIERMEDGEEWSWHRGVEELIVRSRASGSDCRCGAQASRRWWFIDGVRC